MIKKTIIELSSQEAKSFFLESKSYCTLTLPAYINFDLILKRINLKWSDCNCVIVKDGNNYNVKSSLGKLLSKPFHTSGDNVNYSIFANKDGLYDWRKLQIINPFVYVALVNEIISVH